MWKVILVAILVSLSSPALSSHYEPLNGELVRLHMFCDTPLDAKAIVLSGHPNPIPDDIDCWTAGENLIMGQTGGVIDSAVGPEGRIFDIVEITNVFYINEIGMLNPLSRNLFISVGRHNA
jgi:hypothetical protein